MNLKKSIIAVSYAFVICFAYYAKSACPSVMWFMPILSVIKYKELIQEE